MCLLSDKVLGAMSFADGKARNTGAGSREWIEAITLAEQIAEVQSIFGAKIVINAHAELIVVLAKSLCGCECIGAGGRQGIEGQQFLGNGIDEGQLIIRNRLAGEFIEELAGRIGSTSSVDAYPRNIKTPALLRA